ncbi:MAG: response regulator [Rhodospirillaceae bacterium]|nr:response regulator [Rhodospirillaceae bacterium]MBT4463961.1 response regulator [Rhodospirillaceae bacterium]MBT7355383.1 response regulator [Rhodospirillaceae bacterium]
MKLYLIDDDWEILQAMAALLEAAGHEVDSSVDAAAGLSGAKAKRPDAVLIDLVMADIDGLELCRKMKAIPELAKSKIIMVTSKDHGLWQDKADEAGVDGFLTKPVNAETFAAEIAAIVEG